MSPTDTGSWPPTSGPGAWLTPSSRRAIVCLAAATCGYLLNGVNIPVFGGTSLVFGGVFPLLMVVAYGPWWGLLTAVGTYLETVAGWGHPYGLLVFSLEAWTIGWLLHRRGKTLFQATVTYWAVLGLPVTAICILGLLRPPFPHDWAMVIKYPVNGLLVYVVVQFLVYTRSFLRLPGELSRLTNREESLRWNLYRRFIIIAVLPAAGFAVGAPSSSTGSTATTPRPTWSASPTGPAKSSPPTWPTTSRRSRARRMPWKAARPGPKSSIPC